MTWLPHKDIIRIANEDSNEIIDFNNGFAFITTSNDIIINWITWPSVEEFHIVLKKIAYKYKNRFVFSFLLKDTFKLLTLKNIEKISEYSELISDLKFSNLPNIEICNCDDLNIIGEINHYEKINSLVYNLTQEAKSFLKITPSPIKIGFVNSLPAGSIILHGATNQRAWLRRLFVKPEYRSMGVSKNLINHCLINAKIMGFESVSALVQDIYWKKSIFNKLGFNINNNVLLCRIKI